MNRVDPAWKQSIIDQLTEALDQPDVRFDVLVAIKEGPPQAWMKTFRPGETKYLVIAVGPPDPEVENKIQLALGHA